MKYKVFDVIETTNGEKGTVIEILDNKTYNVNITINSQNDVVNLTEKEIKKIVYKN